MKYEDLLKKAKEKLPKVESKKERFEIPKVRGHIEGQKTIITNFLNICSEFHRQPEQLLKYLQRELATPAEIDNKRLILKRKISSKRINEKIEQYAKTFVLCSVCNKPDTKLIKEEDRLFIRCMACGAKNPVRSKI